MAAGHIVAEHPLQMEREWRLPDRGTVGIIFLIVTESVLFSMFVIAYLIYTGKSLIGPYPKDVLELPILASICLLSSSGTIVFAEHALKHNQIGKFKLWWIVTILLGAYFLWATGAEWRKLIYEDHLTISTNLFGTTFYSLVGLHATHVIIGLIMLTLVLLFTVTGHLRPEHSERVQVLALYWHFVDAVWIFLYPLFYLV